MSGCRCRHFPKEGVQGVGFRESGYKKKGLGFRVLRKRTLSQDPNRGKPPKLNAFLTKPRARVDLGMVLQCPWAQSLYNSVYV